MSESDTTAAISGDPQPSIDEEPSRPAAYRQVLAAFVGLPSAPESRRLTLSYEALREFNQIFDLTVGRFLGCTKEDRPNGHPYPGGNYDYWKHPEFPGFIIDRATQIGEHVSKVSTTPTAAQLRDTALRYMRKVSHVICGAVPPCKSDHKESNHIVGPDGVKINVCDQFIRAG